MLIDSLSNAAVYAAADSKLEAALRFLTHHDIASMTSGRYEIDGGDVFAIVQENALKPLAEGVFESHETYADLQYVAEGCERMLWAKRDALNLRTPYDAQHDIAFWEYDEAACLPVTLEAGDFILLMPWDAHMACLRPDDAHPATAVKAVVKIRL